MLQTPPKGFCTECSLPVKGRRFKFNGDMHSGCAPPCGEEPTADNIPAFIKQKYCPACGLELGDEVKTAPLYMCEKCVRPASSKKRKELPLTDLQSALSVFLKTLSLRHTAEGGGIVSDFERDSTDFIFQLSIVPDKVVMDTELKGLEHVGFLTSSQVEPVKEAILCWFRHEVRSLSTALENAVEEEKASHDALFDKLWEATRD